MRAALCLLVVSLAACQPDDQTERAADAAGDFAAPAATSSPTLQPEFASSWEDAAVPHSLAGEYRVAGIDGEPLNTDFGIALSITEERIAYQPECAGFVWDYTYEGGSLTTERSPGYKPARQPDGSTAACAVAVAPELRQLGEALDAATLARRTPSNGIELSGGGRSATIFSQ